jgi:DNA-binding MurR/RpiR family transcriptional regulator
LVTGRTIRIRLDDAAAGLTPAEARITRVLLAEYPSAGLGSASALARRAGVSDPTVLRLITKLGFQGFGEFQACLLAEIEARLHSPLMMMEAKRPDAQRSGDDAPPVTGHYLSTVAEAVTTLASETQSAPFERAARIILGARGRVLVLGGRFSRHLAGMLAGYLAQFRAGVVDLGTINAQAIDQLIDLGRADTLIVFDYRRYQNDVVRYGQQAAARGTRVILFTDPWRSPLAAGAELIFTAPVAAASPFDTMAPALAQMEALIAHLAAAIDDSGRQRIEAMEKVRATNAVTIDALPAAERQPKNFPGPKTPPEES